MTLWYPGKPPSCTPHLVDLLLHFIDNIHKLISTHDNIHIYELNNVADAIYVRIAQENNECHGTDHILNSLRTLLTNALIGVHTAWRIKDFNSIFEIATNAQLICDILKKEHEKIVI